MNIDICKNCKDNYMMVMHFNNHYVLSCFNLYYYIKMAKGDIKDCGINIDKETYDKIINDKSIKGIFHSNEINYSKYDFGMENITNNNIIKELMQNMKNDKYCRYYFEQEMYNLNH